MREEHRKDQLSTADLAAAAERSDTRAATPVESRVDPRADVVGERVVDQRVVSDVHARGEVEERPEPLLPNDTVVDLRERWADIQASFVDEPRRAVEEADALVAEAIKQLAESFATARANLEQQWDRGGDVSTEDLRQALQRYRGFFSRLLSM